MVWRGRGKARAREGKGPRRWHTRGGRVGAAAYRPVNGGPRGLSLRHREDKDVDVQLLLFELFGGFGRGVGEILWKAANVLQNKLTRARSTSSSIDVG